MRRVRPLTWLRALRYAPRDSTLRAVLRSMIEFMDERGYCFPSQEEIADAASLSEKATRDKLSEATRLHWLARGKLSGPRWKHYWYQATVPDFVDLKKKFKRSPKRRSPESPEARSPDGGDHRNVVPESPEPRTVDHRNDVPTNSPSELTNELPIEKDGASAPLALDGDHDAVERTFKHWKFTHEREEAKLTPKRRQIIAAALKQYDSADLYRCIVGYTYSAFHMGKNDQGRKYIDIELLLRDAKHIEDGIDLYRNPPSKGGHS